jgi:hypothetical protein
LTTITFLGERQDTFNPDAAVSLPGRRRYADVLSTEQPVDDLSAHAHQVTRRAVS